MPPAPSTTTPHARRRTSPTPRPRAGVFSGRPGTSTAPPPSATTVKSAASCRRSRPVDGRCPDRRRPAPPASRPSSVTPSTAARSTGRCRSAPLDPRCRRRPSSFRRARHHRGDDISRTPTGSQPLPKTAYRSGGNTGRRSTSCRRLAISMR